ncbi:MAG TPA: hypothetical protein VGF53_16515 [Pseudolabrys sp.]
MDAAPGGQYDRRDLDGTSAQAIGLIDKDIWILLRLILKSLRLALELLRPALELLSPG